MVRSFVYIEANLPTLVAGLNGKLKKLCLHYFYNEDMGLMEKPLCDTTSIEHIYNSNHTLEIMENYLSERAPEFLIHNLLELNTNKKKEKVIQTKIARYFFIGDFDLSPFLNMNVQCSTFVTGVGVD